MNNIAMLEKTKYETVWTEIPEYGEYSPAMRVVDSAMALCKERNARTLLDAGCGVGRATAAFVDAGFEAVGVDITLKGVGQEIREAYAGRFFECTLWDMPKEWAAFDFIFCVDVMEHIHPTMVGATLSELSRLCGGAAYFNIALFPDGFGARIGEALHLSLFSADEWEEKLSGYFGSVERLEESGGSVSFLCEEHVAQLSFPRLHPVIPEVVIGKPGQ